MGTISNIQTNESGKELPGWQASWLRYLLLFCLLLGILILAIVIAMPLIAPWVTSATCQILTDQPITFDVETAIQACWYVR